MVMEGMFVRKEDDEDRAKRLRQTLNLKRRLKFRGNNQAEVCPTTEQPFYIYNTEMRMIRFSGSDVRCPN